MKNINEFKMWLKKNLKTKIAINDKVVIAFLMTGLFALGTNVLAEAISVDQSQHSIRINISNHSEDNSKHKKVWQTIAIGWQAGENAEINHSILLGQDAGKEAHGSYNIFLGKSAGKNAGALERGTVVDNIEAANTETIKDGNNVFLMEGAGLRSLGAFNLSVGERAGSNLEGFHNIALGRRAGVGVIGDENIIFGSEAAKGILGDKNIIIGYKATAEIDESGKVTDALAIGNESKSFEKSVAIGYKSVAKKITSVDKYKEATLESGAVIKDFAGSSAYGVFSIGDKDKERLLQNVAAGEISKTSTDAINGSQLYQALKERLSIQISDSIRVAADAPTTVASTETLSALKLEFGKGLKAEKADDDGTILVTLDPEEKAADPAAPSGPEMQAPDKKDEMPDKKDDAPAEKKEEPKSEAPSNSGVSLAVAIANLPQISSNGKGVAIAYGTYKGEHSLALGLNGGIGNTNFRYKASAAISFKGEASFGAGLSYNFGVKKETDKIELLDTKVENLKAVVDVQGKEIQNLKAQIQELYNLIQNRK